MRTWQELQQECRRLQARAICPNVGGGRMDVGRRRGHYGGANILDDFLTCVAAHASFPSAKDQCVRRIKSSPARCVKTSHASLPRSPAPVIGETESK